MALSFQDIPIEGPSQKVPPIIFSDIPLEDTQTASAKFEDIPVAEGGSPVWDYIKGLPQVAARSFNTTVVGGIVKPMAEMGEKITTLGGLLPHNGPSVSEIVQPYAEQPKTDLETKTGFDVTAPIVNIEPYTREAGAQIVKGLRIDPNSNAGKAILSGTARLGDLASGFTTPGNVALILTGLGFPKMAQAMAAVFAPGMAQGSAQGFDEAVQGVQQGDAGKIAGGLVSGTGSGVIGGLAGRYALEPKLPFGSVGQVNLTEADRSQLNPGETALQVKFEDIPVATPEVAPQSTISQQPAALPEQAPYASAKPIPQQAETPSLPAQASQIPTDRLAEWQALRSEIESAEPGKRIFKSQEGAGGTAVVSGSGSTFPIKDLAPKKTQLQVIDKALAGNPLTPLQAGIFDRMTEHLDKQKTDFLSRQENNPVPMITGDLNLKVGDEIKVPGDKLRVTKVADDGITLKDGVTIKVDPVFDQIKVVGGEDGIKRAATTSDVGGVQLNAGIPLDRALGMGKSFVTNEIIPAAKDVADTSMAAGDDFLKVLAPASRGPLSIETASMVRNRLAEVARSSDKVQAALSAADKHFKLSPPPQNFDFINRIETGQAQANPQLQVFADQMRGILDSARKDVQDLGTGKLADFNKNYFAHYYSDFDKAGKFFGKRPLEGSKSFLKQRTYDTLAEAIKPESEGGGGLTPISSNPVDYVMFKTREMQRYVMAHKILQEMKDRGLAKFVKASSLPPEGWVKINDKISVVKQYSEADKGIIIRGTYYSPEPAARILNNYLAPGIRGNTDLPGVSKLYSGWMTAANTMNQAQLGISAFHAGFTAVDSIVSSVDNGLYNLAHGRPIEAARSFARAPLAPILNVIKGGQMLKEWYNPTGGPLATIVDGLEKAGGRAKMDTLYRTDFTKTMTDAFAKGNTIGGVLRAPFAAIEQVSKPILEWVVPRMKMGIFYDLAKAEMELHPDMDIPEMRTRMGKVWDSVDNRLGQMVYDNLFWNKTVKDLMMASVRSVGWNYGTFREVGGGLIDIGKAGAKIATGKTPELTHRMTYVMALPLTVGLMGAAYQYLATGKSPSSIKDIYFPQSGGTDQNGNPERVSFPSYMKDIYAYSQHPLQTVGHKATPLLAMVSEMLNNKDYYGTEIWNADDPIYQKGLDVLKYAGKAFEPFSSRGYRKLSDEGAPLSKKIQPFFGITPAPAEINMTKAEKLARDIQMDKREVGSRTKDQKEHSDLKRQIFRDLQTKKSPSSLIEAFKQGKISEKEVKNIVKTSGDSSLERSVKKFELEDALKVYGVSTPEEKSTLIPIIVLKIVNFEKSASEEKRDALKDQIKEFLNSRRGK